MRYKALVTLLLPIALYGQVNFDFEDGSLEGWEQWPASSWWASPSVPIGGARSLRHGAEGAGLSAVSTPLPSWGASTGTVTWRFRLRHGYNPSGSNKWAVMLTSTSSAQDVLVYDADMSGYAIGVNQTSTDDSLRLYRVSNGLFTPLISAGINWEQQIGTGGVGALQVKRSSAGEFTILAATTGQYTDMEPKGIVSDTAQPMGGYFLILYQYTQSAAQRLWVDDIAIGFNPDNTNDHDATVTPPETQIPSGVITTNSQGLSGAVPTMSFRIADQGSSDGLPTIVSSMRFLRVDTPDAVSWREVIAGVTLTSSNGTPVPIISTTILPNTIDVEVEHGAMTIPNGGARDYNLGVYLRPTGIPDGASFSLAIPSDGSGWETHHTGSAFTASFPMEVVSNPFTINVSPTHLYFVDPPSGVLLNGSFSIIVATGDSLGNRSKAYSGPITLTASGGNGELHADNGLVATAYEGVAQWSALTYSGSQPFRLTATATGFATAYSQEIGLMNDTSSVVVKPIEQIAGGEISSLVTMPGSAVEVMRFRIADQGGNDGLPTQVSQIAFTRPPGDTLASYSRNIGGITITVDGVPIAVGAPEITTTSMAIPIPGGALTIPDGRTREVVLGVFLRGSGIEDGRFLQLMIPRSGHGIQTFALGSAMASLLPNDIISSIFRIDVQATQLSFSGVPQSVALGEPFEVQVVAQDANGNTDTHAQGEVSLRKGRGEGWLSIPVATLPFSNGMATWSNLAYHAPEQFTLIATSETYADAQSRVIHCADASSVVRTRSSNSASYVVSSINVDRANAFEVLRFSLADMGCTDGLPTYVQELTFRCYGLPGREPLTRTVAGVLLMAGGRELVPSELSITKEAVVLKFSKGALTIPDSDSLELSLSVYLRKGGIVGGTKLCLYIPATGHGFRAYDGGSYFSPALDASAVGPVYTIGVNATELRYTDEPLVASPVAPFSLSVAATDRYGSIDTTVSGGATLGLNYGPRTFITTSRTVPFRKGVAYWDEVQVGGVGEYKFRATPTLDGLEDALSSAIWCGLNMRVLLDEGFEDGYPLYFPYSSHWEVSTVSPIDGGGSLRHSLDGVAGESTLPIGIGVECMSVGPLGWEFSLRNGGWTPSSGNAFWFVLASDTTTITLGQFNGYAIGVNAAGSSSFITLWRVGRGVAPVAIAQTETKWGSGDCLSLRVIRSPRGEWDIWVRENHKVAIYTHAGAAIDTRFTGASTCGPSFRFTATRAGELWVDNIRVYSTSYPPLISSARCLSLSSVHIAFNQPVVTEDLKNPTNYSIRTSAGDRILIEGAYSSEANPQAVILRTAKLPREQLTLAVQGIRNEQGLVANDSVPIGLGAKGEFGNIVINELMVKPSPQVGLPSREYIELYNRTPNSVSLTGWTLRANDRSIRVPSSSIEPDGFLILCSTGSVADLSIYGSTLGVPSFPSLLNAGMFLALYDSDGQLINWVEYSDAWYWDTSKAKGGYSLEMVDPSNLMGGGANWRASTDRSGGTPGRANSVLRSNPDQTPPRVVEIRVNSESEVEVGFSEPMDSLSISLHSNYSVSNGVGHPLWVHALGPKYSRATLTFVNPIPHDQILSLCFDSDIVDFAGNPLVDGCLPLAIPTSPQLGDIVINEVLFNPFAGGVEFVELYNRSESVFDMSSLWVANRDLETYEIKEKYVASDTARLLLPNGKAVLCVDPNRVQQFYHAPSPEAFVWTPRMPSYRNDNGVVVILNSDDAIVDEFSYNERMHFGLLSNAKGVSLERIHPDLPSDSPSSWQSAAEVVGFATPTGRNSQYRSPSVRKEAFTLSSRVFSPYTEGVNNVLLVEYLLPNEGYTANIMVLDARGRLIKRLANSMLLGTVGAVKWDGLTESGGRAPVGPYVIFIEAFDLRGNVIRQKLTCAVAARF